MVFNATFNNISVLSAHGRWFSPGTPASTTTKTGRHDIPEILLKVVSKRQKSINQFYHGSQFYGWRKQAYMEKTTDLSKVTDKLPHNVALNTPRLRGI